MSQQVKSILTNLLIRS